MPKPRVFLIEHTKKNCDFSTLAQHGELTYLFNEDERRSSPFTTQKFLHEVECRCTARQFDPDIDMLCLAGSLVTVTVTALALLAQFDKLTVLLFSSQDQRYLKRTICRQAEVV